MKKFLVIALAALSFAACTKNEIKPEPEAISFQTIIGKPGTRAIIDGTVYPTTVPFASAAFLESGDAYVPQSEITYNTPVAGKWTTATPYYWPTQGTKLTFFSFSPYKYNETAFPATISSTGVEVSSAWDVDANQTVDFMVADAKEITVGTTYSPVPTVFRHKLSQVDTFKLASAIAVGETKKAGDIEFVVKKISIKNVAYKGTFAVGSQSSTTLGAWTPTTDVKSEYVWYSNETGTVLGNTLAVIAPNQDPVSTNQYLLVLPQDFKNEATGALIEISYVIKTYTGATTFISEDVTATAKLYDVHEEDHKWNMNKKITYKVTIGIGDERRILWEPSVVDWDKEEYTININA